MARVFASGYRHKNKNNLDPFPVHALKRVERPTTLIKDDEVPRLDERQGGFHRSGRGDFGPWLQEEYRRFIWKHPLSAASMAMVRALAALVDGPPGLSRAPLPDDPEAMSRHIKETAFFLLRADLFSYGKPRPKLKWWLDLEEVDEVLRMPPS